jgi:hypothetical protein
MNKTPILRNPAFGKKDLDYYLRDSMNYVENVMGTFVVLYQVDRVNTNVDDIYGEVKGNNIRFH